MASRTKILEELFESFQTIKRNLVMCPKSMHQSHRITPSQWALVRIIAQKKQSTVKELAQLLSISSSAATQLIDGLVKEGFVIRKESIQDRRSTLLTLTPETEEKLLEMKKEALSQLNLMFEILSDEELKSYLELNQKISKNISPK